MKIQLYVNARNLIPSSLNHPGQQGYPIGGHDISGAVLSKVAGCYVMHESLQDPEARREMERFGVEVEVCRTTEIRKSSPES